MSLQRLVRICLTAPRDALLALDASFETLTTAYTDAAQVTLDVLEDGTADYNAALASIEDSVFDSPAGLNFDIDDANVGVDVATANDVTMFVGEDLSEADFGLEGLDVVSFGAGYDFVSIDADTDVAQTAVLGDANALEVFMQNTAAGVTFYVESSAAEGSTTEAAIMDVVTFTSGDADNVLTIADLTIDMDAGLVSNGTYSPLLIA